MSPEAVAPGNVIFVDTWLQDGRLLGQGERIASPGYMTVSWYAIEQPPGSHALGDGVAYIYEAYRLTTREIAAVAVPRSRGRYYWRDKALGGGLMFVLLLPEGQTIAIPDPLPREAKAHDGRIAVYWKSDGRNGEAVVTWKLEPLTEQVEAAAEQLNDLFQEAAGATTPSAVQVTDDHAVWVQLRDLLLDGFNNDELADLAFELDIDVEDLPAERSARAREMVNYLGRRGRLGELSAAGFRARPALAWPLL